MAIGHIILLALTGFTQTITPAAATRADLARAYVGFEQALRRRPVTDWPPDLGRRFDAASALFFAGGFGRVIDELGQLRAELDLVVRDPESRRRWDLVKVVVIPPVAVQGAALPTVRLHTVLPMTELPGWPAGEVHIVPRHGSATPLRAPIVPDMMAAGVTLPATGAGPGIYDVFCVDASGYAMRHQPWYLVERSFDAERAALLARMDRLAPPAEPADAEARAIARARAELLTDALDPQRSVHARVDLVALLHDVTGEVEALEAGRRPYRRRTATHWRVVPAARDLPLWVHAPAAAVERSLPLVIALHGAGADERMFIEGYGAGRIIDLADAHGFIVAAPYTPAMMGDAAILDALIASLQSDYAIDTDRIMVIGHSLGGMLAAHLAVSHADRLAATCSIAGGWAWATAPRIAPTLAIASMDDGINPPARMVQAAQRAHAAGLPIELREVSGHGHTLVVGQVLPDAIAWLLRHRRAIDSPMAPGEFAP